MWRSRFEEDWERRKQYLIRSLFEELPPLTPVPEEDESFDSPRRATVPPRSYIPTSASRPNSPLPPLIIEREPNRHDEPEEYYRKLEKKILKIYRKLFIEGKSDISIENSEAESSISEEINDAENDMEEEDGSLIDNLQNTTTNEMVETRKSNTAEEQSSISTEDDNVFNEEFNDSNKKNNISKVGIDDSFISNGNEESQDSNEHTKTSTVEIQKQCRKRTILEDDNEASKSKKSRTIDGGSTTEILPESLEEESHTTSLHSRNDGSRAEESEIQENDFRDHRIVEVVADIHISAGEEALQAVQSKALDAIEDDVDTVMLENNGDNVSYSSGCERSWSSVSEESISHEDAGTQTNYDYEAVNQNILRDIFVGPPKVFRLCSCVNHMCVC